MPEEFCSCDLLPSPHDVCEPHPRRHAAVTLTPAQAHAVDLAASLAHRVICVTGGPGTGKTTTLRALLDLLDERGTSYELAAPSGKAAIRMRESTGRPARTIHSMLGRGLSAPVDAEVLVLDESSMVDVELFHGVVKCAFQPGHAHEARFGDRPTRCLDDACTKPTRAGWEVPVERPTQVVRTLVLVGDADQLPPVGPGAPFCDLLDAMPTVRLDVVHRQAQDSGIIRAAHRIRQGKAPEWCPDVRLRVCETADGIPVEAIRAATDLCMAGHDADEVQILAAQNTGPCGVSAINAACEEGRGPEWGPPLRTANGKQRARPYRRGSKVIHTRNDYDLGVMNGEVGRVVELQPGLYPRDDRVVVDYGERPHGSSVVEYRGSQCDLIRLAWAITTHKSQGSEWAAVVVVAHRAHAYMLTRPLIYVAATRARQEVVVVGTADAVAAAARRGARRRKTSLARWTGEAAAARATAESGGVA